MVKTKTNKKKLSECCNGRMIGGVQCENCGSDGKLDAINQGSENTKSSMPTIKRSENL